VSTAGFDELVAAAEAAPVAGWDFSWLNGRATEARPPWGFTRLVVPRLECVRSVLDVQTGGGEVFAEVLERARTRPPVVAATDSWPPNIDIARRNLGPFAGTVAAIGDTADMPFDDASFELVVARHPVSTRWDEIARVLVPGGSYFAQHVGSGSNRELTDFMMGPQPVSGARAPERAAADATAAGLDVVDLRVAACRVEFFDIGAVVYFLRTVIWTVPDFSVDRYRDRLLAMHEQMPFVSHAHRVLIEARKP
jgi:SAM-dependent methyltransferase